MNPLGRSISDFGELSIAEKCLLTGCRSGGAANVSEELPASATDADTVRAEFIRFLLLEDSSRVLGYGRGLHLRGAFIQGTLDLSQAIIKSALLFESCRFESPLKFWESRFEHSVAFKDCALTSFFGQSMVVDGNLAFIRVRTQGVINIGAARISDQLNCEGTKLEGEGKAALLAEAVEVRAGIFLTRGFSAIGLVSFASATVGGNFNCANSRFTVEEGVALTLDSAVINGSVFLRMGFCAVGTVNLLGVKILNQLSCLGAQFSHVGKDPALTLERGFVRNNVLLNKGFKVIGRLNLLGLEVDGNVELDGASVEEIMAAEMHVKGTLYLRNFEVPPKAISLVGAKVSILNDDAKSWGEHPVLNGFVYDFIDVYKSMAVGERMDWLKKQKASFKRDEAEPESSAQSFRPQPWRHLQRVLENMGRTEEAREIGIEYENCLREYGLIGQTPENWKPWRRFFYSKGSRFLHAAYGHLTGFGYRPMLLLQWFLLVWVFCTAIYWTAASFGGVFAPSNPLVFQNEAYETCRPDREQVWLAKRHDRRPAELPVEYREEGNWYLCEALREEYTGFSPIAFSLDLLLPLVDLHQENDWAPLIETPKANLLDKLKAVVSVKRIVRFVMWCEILAGWGFSLLFVAIVSGLARRKE
ncbi:membrane-associated oxidoreductase [Pseudomonas purpurea]|uniref:membrane-associated oxidoreductase n=1 Tax=Pseudomonas purpurea TaxID=3136737 RepID=UPI0032655CA5